MCTWQHLLRVLLSILWMGSASTGMALECTGILHHMFGEYPIKYQLDDERESTTGYVKYWGPATEAWIEGTYEWNCDDSQNIRILIMRFGDETNVCKSFHDYEFDCRSDMSPMEWEITCSPSR